MPVYGQPTDFNLRLSSLMSCVVCNSNDLYDGVDRSVVTGAAAISAAPPGLRDLRPVFADAVLRKASTLADIERAQQRRRSTENKALTVLEVVLVTTTTATIHHQQQQQHPGKADNDVAESRILADLLAHLFSMPEDGVREARLEVSTVRSHAIREDLAAATARSLRFSAGDGGGVVVRRRVFVALGSALEGLCLYLCREEAEGLLRSRGSVAGRTPPPPFPSGSRSILAVVCVDPPPCLRMSCGRFVLDQTSRRGIPLLFVGYTEKLVDDLKDDAEGIPPGLGELLTNCRSHPNALAVVAKSSARVLRRRGDDDDEKRAFEARFWLARLLVKYTESVQNIRSPPRGTPEAAPARDGAPGGRSML